MTVRQAVERLRDQSRGVSGMILLQGVEEEGGELIEHVLVRRSDIELLLSTWAEKRA